MVVGEDDAGLVGIHWQCPLGTLDLPFRGLGRFSSRGCNNNQLGLVQLHLWPCTANTPFYYGVPLII